ncbi:MAG: DUF4389 domain-containing protein [Solirubrobacteraceae bacterium]
MNDRPVHLIVGDDLERSRASVFFRLILAIPHLIWLSLWGIAAALAVIANWFATLFAGQSPDALHNFLAAYVRYAIHVGAYLFLAAQPFPDFTGAPGYPVDVEIAPPQPQNRWKVAFRIVLAIPAFVIAGALTSGSARTYGANYSYGLASLAAVFAWFAAMAQARMPRGLRDAIAYGLSYSAQVDAYLFLLTDRYPNSDPQTAFAGLPVRETDPIRLEVGDELQRSKLTVFFRFILTIPHLIWLALWGVLVFFAAIANWLATLVNGQSPAGLHNFLAAYVRYQTHVYAYLFLIADPFPGFLGEPGSYPVEASIAEPRPQNPWKVAFRLILGIPVLLLDGAYGGLLFAVAFLGWFVCLATGQMPRGMRNAGALGLRYSVQAHGYLLVLTEAYPYSGPTVPASPSAEPAPLVSPTGL